MIVISIIVTIVSIAIPYYQASLIRAKESVLRSNLQTMRAVIDQYTFDKERPPQSLQELVDEGYLREIPIDPITESRDTWQVIVDSSTPGGESGVWNVKSGSDKSSLDGTPYNDW